MSAIPNLPPPPRGVIEQYVAAYAMTPDLHQAVLDWLDAASERRVRDATWHAPYDLIAGERVAVFRSPRWPAGRFEVLYTRGAFVGAAVARARDWSPAPGAREGEAHLSIEFDAATGQPTPDALRHLGVATWLDVSERSSLLPMLARLAAAGDLAAVARIGAAPEPWPNPVGPRARPNRGPRRRRGARPARPRGGWGRGRPRRNPAGRRAYLPVGALNDLPCAPLHAAVRAALFAASPVAGSLDAQEAWARGDADALIRMAPRTALADALLETFRGADWTEADAAFATRALAEWWDATPDPAALLDLYARTDDRAGLLLAAAAAVRAALPDPAGLAALPAWQRTYATDLGPRVVAVAEARARGTATPAQIAEARAATTSLVGYRRDPRDRATARQALFHLAVAAEVDGGGAAAYAARAAADALAADLAQREDTVPSRTRARARAALADVVRGVVDPPEIVLPRRRP